MKECWQQEIFNLDLHRWNAAAIARCGGVGGAELPESGRSGSVRELPSTAPRCGQS